MSLKLYRVEKDNGLPVGDGPYVEGDSAVCEALKDAHNVGDSWPAIHEDFALPYSVWSKQFCGCPTLDSLKEWFGEFLEPLLVEGYDVVEYVVQGYTMGRSGKQVIFEEDLILSSKIIY